MSGERRKGVERGILSYLILWCVVVEGVVVGLGVDGDVDPKNRVGV